MSAAATNPKIVDWRRPIGATPNLKAVITDQFFSLVQARKSSLDATQPIERIFGLLTRDSLDRPVADSYQGLSHINANGLPFQWVFSLSSKSPAWGFLCECGRQNSPVAFRANQTLALIDVVCGEVGAHHPTFLKDFSRRLIPGPDEAWPEHWRSAIWVGVSVTDGRIVIKPYFNLSLGSVKDRWLRAGWVLRDLGRDEALKRLCDVSALCSADSTPTGLAVDIGSDGQPGRVKIYFRSEQTTPEWLSRWYEALGENRNAASVREFLDRLGMTGGGLYPRSAFVTSLEFHRDQAISVKTDLAVTKWMHSDALIAEQIEAILSLEAIKCEPFKEMLEAVSAFPPDASSCTVFRFVGLGSEPDGSRHLNIYIEPPVCAKRDLSTSMSPTKRRFVSGSAALQSIERGIDALFAARRHDCWNDFALPVGASDVWVTAYLLTQLADAPVDLICSRRADIEASLDWLSAQQSVESGGWGFNRTVPDDADSTSWAILSLRRWNRPPSERAVAFLRSCERNGGFATYPVSTTPKPAWSCVAPCVTAIVLQALDKPQEAALAYFSCWIDHGQLIPAYWWTSPVYSLAMALVRCDTAPRRALAIRDKIAAMKAAGAFESALLLDCRRVLGVSTSDVLFKLMESQCDSGLFPPSASLRLTACNVEEPWLTVSAGPRYLDELRLFTTATAVGALARWCKESKACKAARLISRSKGRLIERRPR